MNRYWQVANTYFWRPRFWFFAAWYPFIMYPFWRATGIDPKYQVIVSLILASIIGCFVALHVRRQFGNQTAQLTPGFTLPHLIVAALASGFLWAIAPAAMTYAGNWPRGAFALHAAAGFLVGAVACWPRAIILLVAAPFLLGWASRIPEEGKSLLDRLLVGNEPALSAALIFLAVLTNVAAVAVLVRLPRRGSSVSDDLELDSTRAPQPAGRLTQWALAGRDAAAERLQRSWGLWGVQRWRVPVATPLWQLAAPFCIVLAAFAVGTLFGDIPGWVALAAVVTVAFLLVAPFSPWHLRRRALSLELMRPVARDVFFRQIALALALDVCLWAAIASLIAVVVPLPGAERFDSQGVRFLISCLAIIWSMALFLYGVAMVTMRWPFWIPIIAVLGMMWLIGVWMVIGTYAIESHRRPVGLNAVGLFSLTSALVGLALARFAYRRWLRMDVA